MVSPGGVDAASARPDPIVNLRLDHHLIQRARPDGWHRSRRHRFHGDDPLPRRREAGEGQGGRALQPRPKETRRRLDVHPGQFRPARHPDGPVRSRGLRRFRRPAQGPERPARGPLRPERPARQHGDPGPGSGQARARREADRPHHGRRRGDDGGGEGVGQAADGRPRPAVLPGIRLRPRRRRVRPLRQAQGRPVQAGDLEARLVVGDLRQRPQRRAGDRPAHPRHPLHRPDLRGAQGGALARGGRRRGGRLSQHTVPLRRAQPRRVVRLGRRHAVGPAVPPRVRARTRTCDHHVRVRQRGRARHAALGAPARRRDRAADPRRGGRG